MKPPSRSTCDTESCLAEGRIGLETTAAWAVWLLVVLALGCVQSPTGMPGAPEPGRPGSPSSAGAVHPSSALLSSTTVAPASIPAPALSGRIVFSDGGDVYRLDLPNGNLVRLSDDPRYEFDPDISPDGARVAYRMAGENGDWADVWVMDADGSGKRNLTMDESLSNWAPAWSPDGSRMCFNSTRGDGPNRIWLMNPDGTELQLVTHGWGEYCDWSPDGQRIVYASAPGGGSYDLWVTGLDGSEPTWLTDLPGTEFFPSWSPDGRLIAFVHLDEGVRLIAPDGSDPRFLGEGGSLVWSPDGRLGFDRPGGFALYDPVSGTIVAVPLKVGRFPSWSGYTPTGWRVPATSARHLA